MLKRIFLAENNQKKKINSFSEHHELKNRNTEEKYFKKMIKADFHEKNIEDQQGETSEEKEIKLIG